MQEACEWLVNSGRAEWKAFEPLKPLAQTDSTQLWRAPDSVSDFRPQIHIVE